jgi:sugar O-acyltransferase (sialic acid O-acetyltransferase NeuD family)
MHLIKVPFHSPNDSKAVVVSWHVENRSKVAKGQTLVSLESSKSIFEIESPIDGYVATGAQPGDEVESGQAIGGVSDTPDEALDLAPQSKNDEHETDDQVDRKVTARARVLAEKNGIYLESIPGSGRINASDVEQLIQHQLVNRTNPSDSSENPFTSIQIPDSLRLLILGAGNGARNIIDVLLRSGKADIIPVAIADDNPEKHGTSIFGINVVGNTSAAEQMYKDGLIDCAVIAISSNITARADLYERFTSLGVKFPNIIDRTVEIGFKAQLGEGNVIFGPTKIGTEAILGNNNFLSSFVDIEHHCVLGSHNTFGPQVALSGGVKVGTGVLFGTAIGCEPNINIGDASIIASGSVITRDIPANSTMKSQSSAVIRQRNI